MPIYTIGYQTLTKLETPRDIRWTLERLAEHFKIESPKLKWSSGRRRGVYLKHDDTLLIGPNCWNGLTDTVLHCFTHCLVHKTSTDLDYHGLRFLESLWQVVLVHYKNPNLFGYWNEHTPVFEYFRNRLRMHEEIE